MPRLNLLRAHRRSNTNSSAQAATDAITLPPLDVGSPGLGSPGQWLQTNPNPSTTTFATQTTDGVFSRTSTPGTALTAPTPAPGIPPLSPPLRAPPPPPPPPPPAPPPQASPSFASPQPSPTKSAAAVPTSPPTPALPARSFTEPAAPPPQHRESLREKDRERERGKEREREKEKEKEKEKDKEKEKEKSKTRPIKLARLNPISLLRRRSSQSQLSQSGMIDDFDPKIIYGTRHPDWSSAQPRDARRSLSPVPVGPGGVAMHSPMSPPLYSPPPPPPGHPPQQLPHEQVPPPIPPPTRSPPPPPPPNIEISSAEPEEPPKAEEESDRDSKLSFEIHDPSTPVPPPEEDPLTPGGRKRVTLVDVPLNRKSSRFSFEADGSHSHSHSPSDKPADPDDDRDADSLDDGGGGSGSFEFDLDDGGFEDDGFERANEGLGLGEDSYNALQAAVKAMDLGSALQRPQIGIALSTESAQALGADNPLGISPEPQPTQVSKLSTRRRLANPRNLDLSDDSDLDAEMEATNGLEGYEDEDEEFYFDDGVITNIVKPVEHPNNPAPPSPTIQPPTSETSPTLPTDPNLTTQHSTDGSSSSTQQSQTQFPPFINPVGGGLGYTQQSANFYNPNTTLLNLSALNYTLQQLQAQQQLASPSPAAAATPVDDDGFTPNFGFPEDDSYSTFPADDDGAFDEDFIAAVNSEALASDSEGWYSREFGFLPGAQNDPLQMPRSLRPALTPISERSESSYRNSMVFPVAPWTPTDMDSLRQLRRSAWGEGWASGEGSPVAEVGSFLREGVNSPVVGSPLVSAGLGSSGSGGGTGPIGTAGPGVGGMGTGVTTGPPPGLTHAGSRAMLPTKASFEEGALGGVVEA